METLDHCLCTEAAIDIDNQILGRNKDYTAILELSTKLEVIAKEKAVPNGDLMTIFRVFYKYSDVKASIDKNSDVSNLVYRISLVSQELRNIKELPEERLEALRGFCVNLSRKIMAADYDRRYKLARLVAC
jgi:hypothetical protein